MIGFRRNWGPAGLGLRRGAASLLPLRALSLMVCGSMPRTVFFWLTLGWDVLAAMPFSSYISLVKIPILWSRLESVDHTSPPLGRGLFLSSSLFHNVLGSVKKIRPKICIFTLLTSHEARRPVSCSLTIYCLPMIYKIF